MKACVSHLHVSKFCFDATEKALCPLLPTAPCRCVYLWLLFRPERNSTLLSTCRTWYPERSLNVEVVVGQWLNVLPSCHMDSMVLLL